MGVDIREAQQGVSSAYSAARALRELEQKALSGDVAATEELRRTASQLTPGQRDFYCQDRANRVLAGEHVPRMSG
jgi:hypothetical protein